MTTLTCPRCGETRPPGGMLFCPGCGAAFDPAELRTVHMAGVPGQSPRVERFLATGDPDYTDARIPIEHTDRQQSA